MKKAKRIYIIICGFILLFTDLHISLAETSETVESNVIYNDQKILSTDPSGTVGSIMESYEGERVSLINLPTIINNNPTITKLILPESINRIIVDENFYGRDYYSFQVYTSITPNCPNLEAIEVDGDNDTLTSVDGVLYSKDMSTLIYCPPGKKGDLIIPEGVKYIDEVSFQECSKLTSIKLPSTVEGIREAAFGGNSGLKILEVSESNKEYESKSNVIFTKDGEELVVYPGGITDAAYSIPKYVKRVGAAAFMGNKYLQKITTCETLSNVGVEAFENCSSLKTVRFTKGLRDISMEAFLNCSSLTDINFPEGTRRIEDYAFKGCTSLLELSFPKSVQWLPIDLNKVENRVLKFYSPFSGALDNDFAEGITVYGYKNTLSTTYTSKKGPAIKYFSENYVTMSPAEKVPAGTISGKGKADTSWYNKSKKVFNIKNPDQLAGLTVLLEKGIDFKGKTVSLLNNLNLNCYSNWSPIIGKTAVFKGTFNGNNHTIYNMRINRYDSYQGLFGKNDGTIRNLNVHNAEVLGTYNVGIITGWDTGVISNCNISGKVYGYDSVGGIAGSGKKIDSCTVNAVVDGIYNVGGICGTASNIAGIISCKSNGTVSGYDEVGGVAGYLSTGSIEKCTNNMAVTGDICVGGITGQISYEGSIINSTNKGKVTGNESVGGIVGGNGGTSKNCSNQGEVTGIYNVGGITGYTSGGLISNCKNRANVTGISNVGGVVGWLAASLNDTVIGSTNTGTVMGERYTGTVIGKNLP